MDLKALRDIETNVAFNYLCLENFTRGDPFRYKVSDYMDSFFFVQDLLQRRQNHFLSFLCVCIFRWASRSYNSVYEFVRKKFGEGL